MSDVIETLDKNIKTIEMLEKEYAKRATPRMKYVSVRSALNNAVISLKKTKDRYSEELAKEPQVCEWKLFDEDMNAYDTSCGESFYLTDGTPNENKMQYCPYCGRKIKVIEDD